MLLNSKTTSRLTICFTTLCVMVIFQLPAAAQCESATDAKMVSDMYAKIKADKALSGQIRHINVSSLNLVIKLQGFTNRKSEFDRLVSIALKMPCMRMVNSSELSPEPPVSGSGGANQRLAGGGCTSGTKPCGDICIPEADICNIEAFLGFDYEPLRFLNLAMLGGNFQTGETSCGMN